LPKAVNTGFIPICLLKKTEAIWACRTQKLAALYGRQTDETINTQIKNGDLVEICHAQQS
jgi:hypothetical protein